MTKREQNRRYREKYQEREKERGRRNHLKNKEQRTKYKKEYYKENKEKFAIWARLNYLKNKGVIKLSKCEKCKVSKNLIMHHEDYNKPFKIMVLCRKCHNKLHHLIT